MSNYTLRRSGYVEMATGDLGYRQLFRKPTYTPKPIPGWKRSHFEIRKTWEKADVIPPALRSMTLTELNLPAKNGQTLLHTAVIFNRIKAVTFLLQKKVDLNTKDRHKEGPLHASCRQESAAILRLLLGQHLHLNPENKDEKNPIHLAAESGKFEHVKLLAEAGVRLSVSDINGHSPLYWASHSGHLDVVQYLESKKAKLF